MHRLSLVSRLAPVAAVMVAACAPTPTPVPGARQSPPLMVGTDMMRPVLYVFDTESDRFVTADLSADPRWPGGMPLHAIATPDGRKVYLSLFDEAGPLNVAVIALEGVDFDRARVQSRITNVIRVDEPAAPLRLRIPQQTDPRQPVTDVWRPATQQLHGPSIHPNGRWIYFSQWTSDKIRVIDVARDRLAATDPIQHGELTQQIHGVFFNPSGTRAIANPYFFDRDYVVVFRPDPLTGALDVDRVVRLTATTPPNAHAAWTHFVDWLDDRYAVTATQQLGPTSLTPAGSEIVGPSVWLVDAVTGTARMIIGPTADVDGAGVYKPASDLMVIAGKLYIAEEDTGDDEINESYISVFDLTDRLAPRFIARLRPGRELPADWTVSHEFYRTPDNRWLYAQSWHSGHLVKIDPRTARVVKTWSKADGFMMPHGNFVVGNLR